MIFPTDTVYIGNGSISGGIIFTATTTTCQVTLHTNLNTVGLYKDFSGVITLKEVTVYPIANGTDTVFSSAKQLAYGAQTIAWKRDALGLPLGMSKGMQFDNSKSVLKLTTTYSPLLTDNFIVEAVLAKGTSVLQTAHTTCVAFQKSATNTVIPWVFSKSSTASVVQTENYAHYVIEYTGTSKLFNFYKNGVLVSTSTVPATLADSFITFGLGDFGIKGSFKVYKPSQVVKFNIAKSWANAQKVIAKLP